jgi:hypothetical protein
MNGDDADEWMVMIIRMDRWMVMMMILMDEW